MENPVIIYGGGGHAKTVIALLRLLTRNSAGILDDGIPAGTEISGIPVLGGADLLKELRAGGIREAVNAVGGIGNYAVRWNIFEQLRRSGFNFPTLVHPAAFVEDNVSLSDGVQVLAQSYISSESVVGFGTLINAGVILSHECVIGQCVNLSPGALLAGQVRIDDFAQVGMGATINLGVRIGSRARVGNSAVIKADVPSGGRVYAGSVWPLHRGSPIPQDVSTLKKMA